MESNKPESCPIEAIKQYYEDILNFDKPWELWEFKSAGGEWRQCTEPLTWPSPFIHRRSGNKFLLKLGEAYFYVTDEFKVGKSRWYAVTRDRGLLEVRNIFHTEEEAQEACDAIKDLIGKL
mgnify:CR=1 FL=1